MIFSYPTAYHLLQAHIQKNNGTSFTSFEVDIVVQFSGGTIISNDTATYGHETPEFSKERLLSVQFGIASGPKQLLHVLNLLV